MRYLKITWRNTTDLGSIYYAGGLTNIMYLDVEVSKPEYPVEVEAEKDGENVSIPTFKKWAKAYKFALWATEDIVDAFTLMQIHDTITVTLQTGQQINVQNGGMTVGVEWMEKGCLAKLDVTFTEDYITGTNCDANLNDECYCETSGGDFLYIAAAGTFPIEADGSYGLGFSVADIVGKKYTAKLYVCNSGVWSEAPTPVQFTCWNNIDAGNEATWIYDGQFWHLMPGYIISLVQPNPPAIQDIVVIAYIPPGCFGNVYYQDSILGWVNAGAYTDDELAVGVTVTPPQDGSTDFKIEVWNHSCNYGFTEIMNIVIL